MWKTFGLLLLLPSILGAASPNLLKNGDFSAGMAPWWSALEWEGKGTFEVERGELKIVITDGSNQPWHVMVGQTSVPVVAGRTYQVSLQARASRPFVAPVALQLKHSPYTAYFQEQIHLTLEKQALSYTFKATATDPEAGLQFNLGNQGPVTLWLSQLSLREVNP